MEQTVTWKTCPKCTKVCRKSDEKCACGYEFGGILQQTVYNNAPPVIQPTRVVMGRKRKRKIAPTISQGAWVEDMPKGMPKIVIPHPLEKGQSLSNDDLREYISYEGLGFCVQSYIDSERIEDETIASQWKKVKEEMDKLVDMLWES